MSVNADKPERWKPDIAASVDYYNDWFMRFAPMAYRAKRVETMKKVKLALKQTANLNDITPAALKANPSVLSMLRMATAPPIARDRLIGLAGVSPNLVRSMEINEQIPPRMKAGDVVADLSKVGVLIQKLADPDIFVWLERKREPTAVELARAITIVADRLCGAEADPIIRNAQEQRQLAGLEQWLERRGYHKVRPNEVQKLQEMRPGTFAFRLNIPVDLPGNSKVNIPVDIVVKSSRSKAGDLPLLVEAKSAGDYTNTNKRRKEEATKMTQLRNQLGDTVQYVLFLCGYFDSGYLGYEAAEGIDWVWEHRMDDFSQFGL